MHTYNSMQITRIYRWAVDKLPFKDNLRFLKRWYLQVRFYSRWILFRNKIIHSINHFEKKIYSENGEDGILEIIFYKIKTTNKICIEFGVGDGKECNTRHLIEDNGWQGLLMDARDNTPLIKKEFITAENINSIFKKYKVPKEFDLLSIDIDGNDYWVWKALKDYDPRVVVIEYNSSIPPAESKVIIYDPSFTWDRTNYFGASLLALANLGKIKGYTLIGCDVRGVNAFFVKNELIKDNFQVRNIDELYRAPRYGTLTNGIYGGHPVSQKKMVTIK